VEHDLISRAAGWWLRRSRNNSGGRDYIMEQKARRLGASEFGLSDRQDKRFYVVYDGKIIHFGLKTDIHLLTTTIR
jgi:hypothetical protein